MCRSASSQSPRGCASPGLLMQTHLSSISGGAGVSKGTLDLRLKVKEQPLASAYGALHLYFLFYKKKEIIRAFFL